jgi:DNA-binding response OmpR family regulator
MLEALGTALRRRRDYLSEQDFFAKRVLIIDAHEQHEGLRSLGQALERAGFTVFLESDVLRGLARLRSHGIHVVLADPGAPLSHAEEIFSAARRFDPRVGLLVMTELQTVQRALPAIGYSATDFLFKPLDVVSAVRAVQAAWQRWEIENRRILGGGPVSRPVKVLLLEDNDVDAALATVQLGRLPNSRVLRVEDLSQAFQIFAEGEQFDLIVLDLGLPDCQGLETFFRLRSRSGDTPIVVLTSEDDDSVADQVVAYGAQDFIPKGKVRLGLLTARARFALQRYSRGEAVARLANAVDVNGLHGIAVHGAVGPRR